MFVLTALAVVVAVAALIDLKIQLCYVILDLQPLYIYPSGFLSFALQLLLSLFY